MKEFDFFKMLDLGPERAGLYFYCLNHNFCLRLRDEERLMQPQNLPLFKAYVADFSLSQQGERLMLEQKNAKELIQAYFLAGNMPYYDNWEIMSNQPNAESVVETYLKKRDELSDTASKQISAGILKPYIKICVKSAPSIPTFALELITAKSDAKLFEIFCQQFPNQNKATLEKAIAKFAPQTNQAKFFKICSKYM